MVVACIEHFFSILSWESPFPGRGGLLPGLNPQPRRRVFIQVLIRARPEEVNNMASRGVNKVILVGNLGIDPDIRYLPTGGLVTALRLDTGEGLERSGR